MNGLRVADFDFDLPEELIAQQPAAERREVGDQREAKERRGKDEAPEPTSWLT